ncbi:MAG TPA: hypothetical protein VML57_02395 [Burkholderiales bacterium]|nr:hypothetical protein [Burkholderiales bacterium]
MKASAVQLLASVALACLSAACTQAQQGGTRSDLSFFVTSSGPGRGADLGGLAGADRHCQSLAAAVGAGHRTWRAYLSASGVDARSRIGRGPWRNARGEVIAASLEALHGDNRIGKQSALTEKGAVVNGRGDSPNMHDILTGSQPDGGAFPAGKDMTCGDWTQSGAGSAMVGHHDRIGLRDDAPSRSWNASHPSRGCSQDALRTSGGNGLFYCFAAD